VWRSEAAVPWLGWRCESWYSQSPWGGGDLVWAYGSGLELGHGLVGIAAPVVAAGGEEASSDGAGGRDRVVSASTPHSSSFSRS
jgi:hypothetical protein